MKIIIGLIFLLSITFNISAQTYEEMVNKAMDFAEKKDYIGAELTLKTAMRKEPDNPGNIMLLVNLGTFQRNLGKLDEALISYNAAIAKFPNPILLLHNRAALYCEMNKLDNALLDYSTIISDNPKDIEALYRRGLIFIAKNSLIDAEHDFNRIIEIDPDNLQAKSALAMLLKREGKWVEAEVAYSYLLSKNKVNALLYLNRAECYLQMDKLGKAIDDLSKASTYGYNDYPLYILRGQVRLAQYDKISAKEDFNRAKELGADEKVVEQLLKLCKK